MRIIPPIDSTSRVARNRPDREDERQTSRRKEARDDDGDKRARHYVSKSPWPSRKIVPPSNLEGKSLPRANQNRGSRTRGPMVPKTICPCPPASVAIVRRGYPRGERSQRGRYFFTSSLATSLNPLHKHCIVFRRGCSHYIIFCY